MDQELTADQVAGALQQSIGGFVRRLRQVNVEGDLPQPERSALARLDRAGPTSSADLARQEQISPQSMGATLSALERRGLIERNADPGDGRRIVLSVTGAGAKVLREKRDARTEQLAKALSSGFTRGELKQLLAAAPLIERLTLSL